MKVMINPTYDGYYIAKSNNADMFDDIRKYLNANSSHEKYINKSQAGGTNINDVSSSNTGFFKMPAELKELSRQQEKLIVTTI